MHAQVSPALGAPASAPIVAPPHHQHQESTTLPESAGHAQRFSLPSSLQRTLLQQTHGTNATSDIGDAPRNLGFTPSAKLVAQHEAQRQNPLRPSQSPFSLLPSPAADHRIRPKYQFHVTKLRSWRTGYCRILALYEDSFATFDPAEPGNKETNRWPYSSLVEWMALPSEDGAMLLQVDKDKLKLSSQMSNDSRATVLSLLLQCADESAQLNARETTVFRGVQRQTRHDGRMVSVALHVKPYGLVEYSDGADGRHERLQTYRYVDMTSCSLSPDGLVIYFHQPFQTRSYVVPVSYRPNGNGRSDLLTLMREQCEILGIGLEMQESVADWLDLRRRMLNPRTVGTATSAWTVTKTSKRHSGQSLTRTLVVTGLGLLVERDEAGIVSARRLSEMYALVRHPHSNDFTIEYANRSSRSFSSPNRDALLVSLLDAASTLAKNAAVHLVDVSSFGYCLSGMIRAQPKEEAGLFRPISIPTYCLKRVNAHSTATYAFVSPELLESNPHHPRPTGPTAPRIEPGLVLNECYSLVEECREFNASVLPSGEGLPTAASDKLILGSVGALWGLVTNLLREVTRQQETRPQAQAVCCTLLQTLYRLSKTFAGYKGSVELSTFKAALTLVWGIDDPFCKFWILEVLNVLVSGLAPKRDLETEYVNKSIIISTQSFVDGLVTSLVEPSAVHATARASVSELVLMSASDLLQGILCSYYETTKPEAFSACIASLARRCVYEYEVLCL
jgi:hypothetical protein